MITDSRVYTSIIIHFDSGWLRIICKDILTHFDRCLVHDTCDTRPSPQRRYYNRAIINALSSDQDKIDRTSMFVHVHDVLRKIFLLFCTVSEFGLGKSMHIL